MIRLVLLGAIALFLFAPAAQADDNRPLTIVIEEHADNVYEVTWKVPVNVPARLAPALRAPEACQAAGNSRAWSDPLGHWQVEEWRCSQRLTDNVEIVYPRANPNLATIATLRFIGAEDRIVLLQPYEMTLEIPSSEQAAGTFNDFLRLGVEHIWGGLDHLLFVAGLIFIAGSTRRVFATITGFTAAHSITLALSALDLVRAPTRAVEGVIALSIVFLAVEIVKGPRDTITWRHPVALAGSFGLLHGFGFAAVLRETGLPDESVITSLLAFNLGIEAGQAVFAGALMIILFFARKIGRSMSIPASLQPLSGYALGVLASFWMIERLAG